VSRQIFDAVQARLHDPGWGTPRRARSDTRSYLLRGRLHCGLCQRRLQGQWIHGQAYYRCRYPAEYAAAAGYDHPRSVNLREADLLPKIDTWLARLTDPDHLQATCEAIAAAGDASTALHDERAAARRVLADCDRRLGRYRAALDAGTDPSVVGQWIAEVTASRHAAEATRHSLAAPPSLLDPEQIRHVLEELGGLMAALDCSDPALRAQLYQELGIQGTYDPHSRIVVVQADLGRPIERVGGGT
jgi:site-specific DNA recombinase